MNLYLDIETIPAGEDKHALLKEIHAKKLAKGSKITADFDEYLDYTSLDGAFGQIVCIGYAQDDEKVEVLGGSEEKILRDFWAIASSALLFIGFNILDFDMRFIYQRSIIKGIKPSKDLSFARYRNAPIYDLMWEWRNWARDPSVSLDTLSKALGIPSSKDGGFDGRQVAQAYAQGRIQEIYDYCKKDVEVTREIYKKMTFAE